MKPARKKSPPSVAGGTIWQLEVADSRSGHGRFRRSRNRRRLDAGDTPGIQIEARCSQIADGKYGFRDSALLMLSRLGHDVIDLMCEQAGKRTTENRWFNFSSKQPDKTGAVDSKKWAGAPIEMHTMSNDALNVSRGAL